MLRASTAPQHNPNNPFQKPPAPPPRPPRAVGAINAAPGTLVASDLVELTPSQAAALPKLIAWMRRPEQQVFRLFGAAGTGKTHLVAKLIAKCPRQKFAVATLSGKAALVLQRAGGVAAQTIHSMLYILEGEAGDGQLIFREQPDHVARDADFIVIDEASMVNAKMYGDLAMLNKPILAIADPHQLPPIEGEGAFMTKAADALLTDVVRQAANSPILGLANDARNGVRLRPGRYGSCKVVAPVDLRLDHALNADQILVGKRATARRVNRRIRELLGFPETAPVPGDKLIGLRNNPGKKLLNGSMWTVQTAKPTVTVSGRAAFDLLLGSLDFPGMTGQFLVDAGFFQEEQPSPAVVARTRSAFAYGYAITVHKAQGSQWDKVLLIDEAFGDKARWRYTAITRAARSIVVVGD